MADHHHEVRLTESFENYEYTRTLRMDPRPGDNQANWRVCDLSRVQFVGEITSFEGGDVCEKKKTQKRHLSGLGLIQ